MKISLRSLVLFLLFSTNIFAQSDRQTSLALVVAAENGFADSAVKNGTRAAFLEYAAENAVVFSDKPDIAKAVWQKRAPNASLLAWRPQWADVSSTGDLGFTTGAWAYSRTQTDAPVAWGEYFTIWKKQPDGSWKFLLDLGIGHDKAEVIVDQWKYPISSGNPKASSDSAGIWNKLESSFSESLEKDGAKKTYEKLASEQIRLLREGSMPFQGKANALLQITNSEMKIKVLGGESLSDLAYTYGEYELKISNEQVEKGFYVRVWKREKKGWRIEAEVEHPVISKKK